MPVLLWVLAPLAATLPGCPGGTYGSVIEPEQKAAIVRGKTTKEELLDELGRPDQTTDLGGDREELLYVRETIANHGNWMNSNKTAFWVIINKNVVEAFGERRTPQSPSYIKWPF